MKKLKRVSVAVISAAVLSITSLLSSFAVDAAKTVADNGVMRDHMSAFDYSKDMGLGLNLGNTMEGYWLDNNKQYTGAQTIGSNKPQDYEKCWGASVTTQEAINGMRDAGFSTVRIPVYWGNMMNNDGNFIINEEYINRVEEIVGYCRNAGMYAVINIHHYDEFLIKRFSKEECTEIFTKLWTQIAEHFKDYSDYLIFEGYNESLGGGYLDSEGNTVDRPRNEAFDWTNTLNQAFVDAVRATGGNNAKRVLIASGYWTNIDLTTSSDFKVPTDTAEDRLMVSVHYVDNAMYWTNQLGNDRWREYSINQCELLKEAFTEKGIPVFIGETTSSYPSNRLASNATVKKSSDMLDYMLRLITSYGFTPVLWDTPGGFYDRNNCAIKSSTDAKVISTLAEEIKVPLPETYTLSGVVKVSDSDTSTDMTVTAVSAEGKEASVSAKSMGNYSIADLEAGTYTLKISGGKYVERTYEITVADSDLAMDVNLNPLGDINSDGKVTTADVGMANSHAKGVKALEGYAFACADANKDGSITTADVGRINSHAKSIAVLW